MGYAGGEKPNPTYRSIGDHAETLQIDYDPTRISYEKLAEFFWSEHDPAYRPWSRQYAAILFWHDEEQRRLAEETAREAALRHGALWTEIVPYQEFWLAEDYHQKYYLQNSGLMKEYAAIYPDKARLVASTAAARVNGYLGGYGSIDDLRAEIDLYGLSEEWRTWLLAYVGRRRG